MLRKRIKKNTLKWKKINRCSECDEAIKGNV